MPRIRSIYRYPIKGLSPEPLERATLAPGETIPGDRLYAIENGPSGFDPARPYLPKTRFLMLMKNERLATLRTSFDEQTHELTILIPSPRSSIVPSPLAGEGWEGGNPAKHSRSEQRHGTPTPCPSPQGGGEHVIRASLRSAEGRAAIENFFAQFCADELRGPLKILSAAGHSFSDVARKVVSIINLASVAAIEDMVGAPVNPLRFRGNLYVDGWPAWRELDLVGKELTITPPPLAGEGPKLAQRAKDGGRGAGSDARSERFPPPLRGRVREGGHGVDGPVTLKVVKRIVRCAATNVDPDTGMRDLNVPQALTHHLGHADCGVYAEVIAGGEIAAGDEIEIG